MLRKARVVIVPFVLLVLLVASPSQAIILFPEEIGVYPAGSAPGAVAVNPLIPRLYVGNTGDATVTTINTLTGETVNTTTVGPAPHGIGVNPVLNRVYVANGESNTVSILNAVTGNVVQAPITIPGCRTGLTGPWGVAVHPVTGIVYVACHSANKLWAINGVTGLATASRSVNVAPLGVAVDPVTNLVYVGYAGAAEVGVFDGASLATVSTIRAGLTAGSWGIAIDPITHRLAVANYFDNTVSVFAGGRMVLRRGGFSGPEWIAFDSLRNRIWIPENTGSVVTAMDATTGSVWRVAISGTKPTATAVDLITGVAYSANFGTLDVSVIF